MVDAGDNITFEVKIKKQGVVAGDKITFEGHNDVSFGITHF